MKNDAPANWQPWGNGGSSKDAGESTKSTYTSGSGSSGRGAHRSPRFSSRPLTPR
jgi:hypothetical protein